VENIDFYLKRLIYTYNTIMMQKLTTTILKEIDLCSKIHKNYKNLLLNRLIEANKHLAPQGSDEWLAIRKYSIGGSEMSTVTKDNPFQGIDNLVAIKTGLITFDGNIACMWGKLFEPVTTKLTEMIFNTDVKETGSLEGCVPNQRYSPDGLAVIKIHCEDTIGGVKFITEEYCIVLFEYKSPLYSIPSEIIPKHYMPQVKTGLCSIPITDFAIFINNLFRKCSFQDLADNPIYDMEFHNRDEKKKFKAKNPLALGMILFYQTADQKQKFYFKYKDILDDEPEPISDSDDENPSDFFGREQTYSLPSVENISLYKYIYQKSNNGDGYIRDYGKAYYRDCDDIFKLLDDDLISTEYCEPHIFDRYNNNKFIAAQNITYPEKKLCDSLNNYKTIIDGKITHLNYNIIGYLPWKLFLSDIIYEPRNATYVEHYNGDIQNTIDIIKDINSYKTLEEKIKAFKGHFPKTKVLKDHGLDNTHNMEFLPRM
jgi:hypothetical protein